MTKKQLDGLSVFALRDIARRVGVSMPTSKKKSDLITEILEIEAGTRQPYFPKTKQGRPPKETGYAYVGSFDPMLPTAYPEFSTRLNFSQPTTNFDYDEVKTVSGYVEITKDNTAFLWTINDGRFKTYFIPVEMLRDWALRFGDYLVAEAGYENRNPVIKNIFSINDVPVKKYIKNKVGKNFYTIMHEDDGENLSFTEKRFADMRLKKADNVFVYGEDNRKNTDFVVDLLNSAEVDKKFYVNCAVVGKDAPAISRLNNAELFISDLTENEAVTVRMLSVAFEGAKRYFEMGKNVLIVIDGLDAVERIKTEQTSFAKSFLSLPKSNKKFGSITLVSVLPKEVPGFNRLADKRFVIENGKAKIY